MKKKKRVTGWITLPNNTAYYRAIIITNYMVLVYKYKII